jgi:hypothetical protein
MTAIGLGLRFLAQTDASALSYYEIILVSDYICRNSILPYPC